MIWGIRRLFPIAVFLLLIFAGLARHFHSVQPTESRDERGLYTHSFNCGLTEDDCLAAELEGSLGFLEARFSNHTAIRYEWKDEASGMPRIVEWKDSMGRRKTLPVVAIKADPPAGQKIVLPLGKDYRARVGSINDSLRLIQVIAGTKLVSVRLSNYFYNSHPSGASFLKLAGEFKLDDNGQPTTIDSSHVQTWEYICPSPDSRRLAISSMSGNLYYLDSSNGKLLWKYSAPDGRLSDVVMSDDNRYVFVGEHSADGNVYCLDSLTGRRVWKYATAANIGSFKDSLPESSTWSASIKPNARDLVWRKKALFVRARRSRITLVKGKRVKSVISQVYAFHQDTGRLQWTYPASKPIEGYQSSTLNVSDDGKYVSQVMFDSDKKANPRILVLDGETGALIWEYQCDTIKKYFKISTCYEGLAFSSNSRYAAAALNDGRVFIFDNEASVREKRGVVLKTVSLVTPIATKTVPVATFPAKLAFTGNNNLIVSTGQTYSTSMANTNLPPINHPDANSIFALDMTGELLWKSVAGGFPAMFDIRAGKGKEYLAAAFSHNVYTRDINDHGFAVFDLTKEGGSSSKVKSFYHTDGICVNSRFSPDLRRLFAIEEVIDMDETVKQDRRGKHRMLIFDLNFDLNDD